MLELVRTSTNLFPERPGVDVIRQAGLVRRAAAGGGGGDTL
jgi:hypothetical protein